MAKRFTDTEKWDDMWFADLPSKYKLLWTYILDRCDNAGFWTPNFKVVKAYIGEDIEPQEARRYLKGRFIETENAQWFFVRFLFFQYPNGLKHTVAPQRSVINKLLKNKQLDYVQNELGKGYLTLKEVLQDKDKEKDKDKDTEKDKETDKLKIEQTNKQFEDFWALYDYKANRKRCEKLWNKLSESEKELVIEKLPLYIQNTVKPDSPNSTKQFRKHPATYLHNRSWEDEVIVVKPKVRDWPNGVKSSLNPADGFEYWRSGDYVIRKYPDDDRPDPTYLKFKDSYEKENLKSRTNSVWESIKQKTLQRAK